MHLHIPVGALSVLLLDLGNLIANNTPSLVWRILFLLLDVFKFWIERLLWLLRHSPNRRLKRQLQKCQSFSEYEPLAIQLDEVNGYDIWRQNLMSKCYDYRLIHSRLLELRRARIAEDSTSVISLLRSGFLRNFGGISSKRLYNKSYIGTKILIEEYVSEVLECLRFVSNSDLRDNTLDANSYYQQKIDFFHEAKQTLGTTALILQGGTLFGLCHIGVMKAMYEHDLLPTVIAGSSIGAVAGALVCSLAPQELENHLEHLVDLLPPPSQSKLPTNPSTVIENVIRSGFSQDILVFIDYVKDLLGDVTFEEAHLRSNRILNIVVYPTDPAAPTLLNYLTTPNVTIVSAVYCSLGHNALGRDVQPMVKTEKDGIRPFKIMDRYCEYMSPYYARTLDGRPQSDKHLVTASPYTRLTELFNANHFVVSLARPYLAPLIGIDFRHSETSWGIMKRVDRLVSLEFRHRVEMLNRFGLLFRVLKWALSDETAPLYGGNQIPIVPEMRTLFKDCSRIFNVGKYKEDIPYWIQVGERSVWPLYPLLQTRCAIEFTLDDYDDMYRRH